MTPTTIARLTGAVSDLKTRNVVLDHHRASAGTSLVMTQTDFERTRRIYESVKGTLDAPAQVPALLPLPRRLHTL